MNTPIYERNNGPVYIDDTAKLIVPMSRMLDRDGNPYFIGKLQFPGSFELAEGASIMFFNSEEGAEELQIGVLDPNKRSGKSRKRPVEAGSDGRLRINLHAAKDSSGQTYYIGEALAPITIPCKQPGIFFTVFTAQQDKEELQITELRHKKRVERGSTQSNPNNDRIDDEDDESFERTA